MLGVNIILRLYFVPVFLTIFQCSGVHSAHVIRISSDINFSGISQDITLGNTCFNLRHPINDNISSIDPNGKCIRLYTDERCRGPYVETEESVSDLGTLNINDAISSIKFCNPISMNLPSRMAKRLKHIFQHDYDEDE